MNPKKQKRKPTRDEFLSYIPKRAEYEWTVDEKGLVHIQVPKFQSDIGKRFCRAIRRENTFTADMDELGSMVWKHCDGNHSVKDILEILKDHFGEEENLDQRLFLFIQQMNNLNYLK